MAISKVAVIGAGVMGASIAAHISNAGIPVYLLDIVLKNNRNRNQLAETAIKRLLSVRPAAFMKPANARLITPGNIEDHLDKVAEVDWVIEAVVEDPAIKNNLYQKLNLLCAPDTVISSNTSTLPVSVLIDGLPETFTRRFFISHFFNPPRYMPLLEVVITSTTQPALVQPVIEFADHQLGKGIVYCNDTPGFIANRIGIYWLQCGMNSAIAMGLTIEQADAALQPFGIPKTGIFGLLDLVGLDLMPAIMLSMKKALPETDAFHQISHIPDLVNEMIAKGYTGRKGKGGFYRLNTTDGQRIKESINLKTGQYHISTKPLTVNDLQTTTSSLQTLLLTDDLIGRYCWEVLSNTVCYSADILVDIANNITDIDSAMTLGYHWQFGPFELLDKLTVPWFVERLESEGRAIPSVLKHKRSLYNRVQKKPCFLTPEGHYQAVITAPGVLRLSEIKQQNSAVLENSSASLWDLGDGVVCLEFHSKMNALDFDTLSLIRQSIDKIRQEFIALVIYNEADNFSVGANLKLLTTAINHQSWHDIEVMITEGQETFRALKYAPFPVVGAPSGLALGGGCEVLLHCDAIEAHSELYMGLVEVGVGLIPGWGGCKEYLHRCLHKARKTMGPVPAIIKVFKTIAMAEVSRSAIEAQERQFLSSTDGITPNRQRLLNNAKVKALVMTDGYQPPKAPVFILPGPSARVTLDIALRGFQLVGKASDYDLVIGHQLAQVISGDGCDITDSVDEKQLLNLELQGFMALVKQTQTQSRLEHMLSVGKPLRN
ncbi:MAG: 3-hydroxyacyl-CoA dehydrogenase/enoyl-CoA hydratase family protein [Methylococcales bacterium]|jgi:3-hydroxyacyl-CoA dehydrogenase|nr:3-hydroxyacyl-CoA dehydrogenase/enoyl-CoA hydratase family protein [Methylococcales bacterium]